MRIRVTQELMTSTVKRNLGTSIEALFKMQDQIATQRRLSRPSDDAVDFAFALNMRDALSVATRYERNSEETRDWLAVTETAVTSAGEMLQHLRTRIVQAANDTLTGEERDDLSKEVNELLEEMVSLANSDNAGRFIFAGHETLRPPFEVNRRDDGAIESVYYRGDDGQMLREIMTADVIAANVTGRELFLESAHRVTSREGTPVFDDPAGLIGDAVAQPQFVPAFTDQMISINGRAIPVLANETVNQLARRISRDPLAQVTASVEQTPAGVVPPGYRLVYNHDNANEAIAFDWVSIDEATALGTWGPGTLYINDHEITIAGADYATVAGEINTQLAALGVTDITAEVDTNTVPGLTFMRIVGPSGEQVEVTDGTSGFVTAATAGGTFLQRTGIVNGTNHIVADQEGPYNIFETLIQLRNDLEAGDDTYFLPPAELVGAGTVVDVDNTSGFISGQFQITTDAAGNVAVDYGATPPAGGVFFDPTYLAEPANETQQRQLDILNRVRVESTTIIADPDVDLSDPFHVNATPPPGWTAANVPTTGTFSVNGEVFTYDGTQSLNELATLVSGNPNINVTAAVTSQGHLVMVDDDGNPVDIQNGTSDVMERLGMTEPGGAETKAITLQRDSLSAFGLSLNVGAPVAGTQIVSVGPLIENHRTTNLTEVGLTMRVPGGGIIDAFDTPSDERSGTHRLTVGPITYGATNVTTTGPVVNVLGNTMQMGGTFEFELDGGGNVVANTMRFVPDGNGGRALTEAELAQLNTLNAGGALDLSAFGLNVAFGGGGAGTVSLHVDPAQAVVTDEFFPADRTQTVVTQDVIYAYTTNNLSQVLPDAKVVTGELVADGQSIITSTSRVREFDVDIEHQLNIGAEIGARTNRAEQNLEALDKDKVNFADLLSRAEDLDVPEALVDLTELENVYRQALAVGSRVLMPTLMDFLR